jgi:hypothetical protein
MKLPPRTTVKAISAGSAVCLVIWIGVFISLSFALREDSSLPFNEFFYIASFYFGYFGTPTLLAAALGILYFFKDTRNKPLKALGLLIRVWLIFHLLFLVFLGTEYIGNNGSAADNALYLAIFYGFIIYPLLAMATTICGYTAVKSLPKHRP